MENWLRIERKHAPAFSILTDYRMFFSGKWCEQHLFLVLHRGFWLEGGAAVFGLGCLLAAWEGGREGCWGVCQIRALSRMVDGRDGMMV